MNSLVTIMTALSLLVCIQSAVGQERESALADLASVSKVNIPAGPSLQLKNVITGDTTSTVHKITLDFYSNATCVDEGTFLGETTTTGGNPLPFPENTTININPASVYAAANSVAVDTTNLQSVAVSMYNGVNDALFINSTLTSTSGIPCFTVLCNTVLGQCTTNTSTIDIDQENLA